MNTGYAPLSLYPGNPRYFLFRGRPEILITSCEHYGAVMNLDFDYTKYLDELKLCGLNATRTFTGYYHEIPGVFGIEGNTLAPAGDAYICPWERSSAPGAHDGKNKYDLDRFNERYMDRLYDFCEKASERGIVIELCFFCPFYMNALEGKQWEIAPFYSGNNINGTEDVRPTEAHNMKHGKLLRYQEELVKKIVELLNGFDNIYYEICNEPYFDGITEEWQRHIAALIAETEGPLANRHLIGQNVNNGYEAVQDPIEGVSVFSFHYTNGDCIRANAWLNKAVGCNETGFAGSDPEFYRKQAWDIFMSGGASYFGLDYSFVAGGHEDGSFDSAKQPGTGSREFRLQLAALKEFLIEAGVFDMGPDGGFVRRCNAGNGRFYAISEKGRAYAVYGYGIASEIVLALTTGKYEVNWLNPVSRERMKTEVETDANGALGVSPPGEIFGGKNAGNEFVLSLVFRS